MIEVWSLDGKSYDNMPIIEYECSFQILDGSGTGRMQTVGWDMFRQPEGTIFNVSIMVGVPQSNNSSNPNFKHLIETLNSFGIDDFKTASFLTPIGTITQEIYSPSYSIKMRRISNSGVIYWGVIPIEFIAKKAYLT